MEIHVHLLKEPKPETLGRLKNQLDPNISITTGQPGDEKLDYHIMVAGRPEIPHLDLSANLRTVIIPFAGIPENTRELLIKYPSIEVHNLHHNSIPTAELAVSLLFSVAKYIIPFDRSLRNNDWGPRYRENPSLLLHGKNVLILGLGNIGLHVGAICHAVGMNIMAIRKNPKKPVRYRHPISVHDPQQLDYLLPKTNALIICLPLTPETQGLIGKPQLDLLPSYSILVNVGRGAIVDEEALYESLQSGCLAGAGLDVWYNYPENPEDRQETPPGNYPFHELNNVVMSPHRGGSTRMTEHLRMDHLAVLLNAAARGEPIPNKVDLQAGY